MISKLKNLLKHSFFYSLTNIASKASGLVLLPIYTKYFSPAEYGFLGLILATVQLLYQILLLGQGQALVRLTNDEQFYNKKKSVFGTILIFEFITIILFTLLWYIIKDFLVEATDRKELYNSVILPSVALIAITVISNIILSKLRAEEESLYYSLGGIIKLIITLISTILFIVKFEIGFISVIYGLLLGEIALIIFFIPYVIRNIKLKLDYEIIKVSLKFGVPLVLSVLSMSFLNTSDRYLIKYFMNDYSLGLYELSYKLSGAVNMFLVIPFTLTLLPASYKMYNKEGSEEFYSRIMTFFTFILVLGATFVSLFSKEVILIFSQNVDYYKGYLFVPFLSFSFVFLGMMIIASLGLYLTKQTKISAVLNFSAGVANILLNLILIPLLGIYGAALSTLVSFVYLLIIANSYSQKQLVIHFEYKKLIILVFSGFIISMMIYITFGTILIANLLIKLGGLALFLLINYFLGVYSKKEVSKLLMIIKDYININSIISKHK